MQSLLEEIQLSLTDVKSRLDDSEFGELNCSARCLVSV